MLNFCSTDDAEHFYEVFQPVQDGLRAIIERVLRLEPYEVQSTPVRNQTLAEVRDGGLLSRL